jgi:hypothetical protein
MAYDRNPNYGADQTFSEGARRVADFLWENAGKDLSTYPRSYLENLRHEYSDGKVSMLELIDRVDLGPDATYEDYCEVVDLLMYADSSRFSDPSSIVEVQPDHLRFELDDPDFDFSEFDFEEEIVEEAAATVGPQGEVTEEGIAVESTAPDPLSDKMELFLKKVISSVYRDGVTSVTDLQGNPPNAANNYLLSDDGKSFSGIFYDAPPDEQAKKYPFQILEKGPDQWQIKY